MSVTDQQPIVQVSREACEQVKSANTTEKVVVTRKPKSSRLLENLFCCFRPTNTTVVQQTPPPPPPHLSSLPTSPTSLTTSTTATTCCTEEPGLSIRSEVDDLPFLLEPLSEESGCDKRRKCAVIDLDETLVHSSFAPVSNADFVIPVEIDGTVHQVYVLKRPHVDEFLQKMGELFECVLFTASLGKYADPVADLLDKWGVFQARLFRESCVFHHGSYVKDLSRLGRELDQIVIIDNSPMSYMFHPQNAVPVISWFDDMSDCELLNLIPFFEALADIDDVYTFLGTADQLPNHADTTLVTLTAANDSDDTSQVDHDVSIVDDTVPQE